MGESVYAVTLPGSTSVSIGAPGFAGATETVGAARELVRTARTLLACVRPRMPTTASTTRMSRTTATPTKALRGERGVASGAVSWLAAAGWGCGLGSCVISTSYDLASHS